MAKIDLKAALARRAAELAALENKTSGLETPGEATAPKFIWNTEQQAAISLANQVPRVDFCLTGAAGTGKSTVTAEILAPLIKTSRLLEDTKYLRKGTPGVAIVAFTRKAANNIRRMVAPELKGNVLTVHKLLEYTRDFEQVWDEASGTMKTKVVFFPARNKLNMLPNSLKLIVVDESSTLSTSLYEKLAAAAPHCKFIFIGDINQLPPVGDDSIFGYKLLELPTVELTQVYRQALESKPLALAHRILSGKTIETKELKAEWAKHPDLEIHLFPPNTPSEQAMFGSVAALQKLFNKGEYDPVNDIVLCPNNVGFGVIELNNWILQFAFPDRQIHEIIAGYETKYLAVDDLVLFNKEEYVVTEINRNAAYLGSKQPASVPVDRWGRLQAGAKFTAAPTDPTDPLAAILSGDLSEQKLEVDVDALIAAADDRVNQASHIVHLKALDTDAEIKVSTSGDMNAISFNHATTVHKAQGSGWDRVFLFIHKSHARLLSRELLYTAVTRVKKKLTIFCEQDTFMKGIRNARIPGKTAAEKAKYFQSKLDAKVLEDPAEDI